MRNPFAVAAVLLMGCAKKPIIENHYYSLVLEAAAGRTSPDHEPAGVRVDLTEVTLPDFLRSRSLVLQVQSNEVIHAKHHHWGEPLDIAIQKVLAWDLSSALPALDIAAGSGRGADCTLTMEFDRFHASDDSRVLVSGRYTLTQGNRVSRREFDVSQVQHGDGYTSAVTGMRSALEALSETMRPIVAGCAPPSTD
jgi:uncharacterized lipoprotein YmbA